MGNQNKIDGSSWTVSKGRIRPSETVPATSDPTDVPEPGATTAQPDAYVVDIPEPEPREIPEVHVEPEPASVFDDDPDTLASLNEDKGWRLRVSSGVEYRFVDRDMVQRFAKRGGVSPHDMISTDGGRTWRTVWEHGIHVDPTAGLELALPKPKLRREDVGGPRTRGRYLAVGALATLAAIAVLAVGAVLVTPESQSRSGVLQSPIVRWYEAAMATMVASPRPAIAVPAEVAGDIADIEVPALADPEARTELRVHRTVAADHADVGADAVARGAWEQAVVAYRRALALEPSNARYAERLGFATEQLMATTHPGSATAPE